MVLNSLCFCLSVKLLNSPLYLNEILAGYSNLGCKFFFFFFFHQFKYALPFPSGLKSFYWKINCYPFRNPLAVICCFSLAAFNICSLCLIFVNLINMCLGVFCLGFILFVTLWFYWTWVIISSPILGKVFNYYLLKYFLMVFLFIFVFWDSYDSNVGTFNIVPEISKVVFISFNYFFHLFLLVGG